MSVACPCGCGRSIPRVTKRTVERAVFIDSLSAVPAHLSDLCERSDDSSAQQMAAFSHQGLMYSTAMISAAHGESASRNLPSGREVGNWEATALKLIRVVRNADPEWFDRWPGPVRNRVTDKGASRRSRDGQPEAVAIRSNPWQDRQPTRIEQSACVGGFLPKTSVEYATSAFCEGVTKLIDQRQPVPAPAEYLKEHADRIFSAYIRERDQLIPLQAMSMAVLSEVLGNQGGEAVQFLIGTLDDTYGSTAGNETFNEMMVLAEFWSGRLEPPEQRIARYARLNVGDVARQLATDELQISRFCAAFGHDTEVAAKVASAAALLIRNKCKEQNGSQASELQRARRVFEDYELKAERKGQEGVNERLWCRTVGAALRS